MNSGKASWQQPPKGLVSDGSYGNGLPHCYQIASNLRSIYRNYSPLNSVSRKRTLQQSSNSFLFCRPTQGLVRTNMCLVPCYSGWGFRLSTWGKHLIWGRKVKALWISPAPTALQSQTPQNLAKASSFIEASREFGLTCPVATLAQCVPWHRNVRLLWTDVKEIMRRKPNPSCGPGDSKIHRVASISSPLLGSFRSKLKVGSAWIIQQNMWSEAWPSCPCIVATAGASVWVHKWHCSNPIWWILP